MSKVSIIVPIYNVEKYVVKCLRSLTSQTFQDIEVLAIDDGSTDESGKLSAREAERDSRIKYIKKENGGYGSVLELGIKKAKSEYFLICDPDDWLEDNCIEELYKRASENGLDMVIGEKYISTVGTDKKCIKQQNAYFKVQDEKCCKDKLGVFYFMTVSPHSKLYRTSLVRDIIFPKKTSFTDLLLYVYAVQKSKSIMYTKLPLSNYLVDRPGNTTTDRKPKTIGDHLKVWHAIYEQCNLRDSELLFRLFFELKYIIRVYIKNSDNLFKDDYYAEILKTARTLRDHYSTLKNAQCASKKDKTIMYATLKLSIIAPYIWFESLKEKLHEN